MSNQFEHGYALIVGVDQNKIPRLALPAVAKDVQAVYDVMIHPERCAYKVENVKLIQGEASTREAILEGLAWLQERVGEDEKATAVLYYSGHGMWDKEANKYYLVPYDIKDLKRIRTYAVPAEDFAAEIEHIDAKRMLAILDCCHAAGMDVKDVDLAGDTAVEATAFPLELPQTKTVPQFEGTPGSKNVDDLAEGEGRAILNSSTGAQSSYVRNDGAMSLFTYHLIEALTGHAPHADDATVVYVTDVMSWVTHKVKQSAKQQGREQTPVMRTSGVFPVAQLLGGQGLSKGMTPPEPLAPLPPSGTTYHQEGQTVHGTQVNTGDGANIGHIGDSINTGGGEYVAGDKNIQGDVVHGDKVDGDKVGGDKISVGNISGSQGIAIGRGASANVSIQEGMSDEALTTLFVPLLQQVAQQEPTAVSKVHTLKDEVAKGEEANDEKIADLITEVADAVPTAVETIVSIFANSVVAKAAGAATQYILKRIQK